jgi:hypothetical protein
MNKKIPQEKIPTKGQKHYIKRNTHFKYETGI